MPPNGINLAGSSCPAGRAVTGGGFRVSALSAAITLGESIEQGSTIWAIDAASSGTIPVTLTAEAICAS